MATVTKGRTFVSGEIVTPAKLNTLVDSATVTAIQTADISDAQITTAKIADSNVTTAKIADSNVTTAKIADGAVTTAKVSSSVIFVPSGAVMAFAMNSAPSGWLAANGTAVSRATYATLFTAIGSTYGAGDGSTTFNLPDLRGYFVRGAGTNDNGTASGTFGAKQASDFASHTHAATVTDPGHTHTTNANVISAGSGLGGGSQSRTLVATNNSATTGITVSNASTGGAETRPVNIAMLYCIKA